MSDETQQLSACRVVNAVRAAFLQEAASVDDAVVKDGFVVEDAPFIWLERFSQLTTNAIKSGDFGKAKAHLTLISCLVEAGDPHTERCIDVAYVESLMWDIKDDKLKNEGWRVIPENLKKLYVAMWGRQPFMENPGES